MEQASRNKKFQQFMGKKVKKIEFDNYLKKIQKTDGNQASQKKFLKINLQKFTGQQKRQIIPDLEYPRRCIGMVYSQEGGKGTGFLIGKNKVLTAAHNCVNDKTKRMVKSISFYPAINKTDYQKNPYTINQDNIFYDKNFKPDEKNYTAELDLAILVLQQNIGEDYGYLGIDFSKQNIKENDEFMMYGYSKFDQIDKNVYQFQMLHSKGDCQKIEGGLICYKQKTGQGQSGGPIVVAKNGEYYVVGVHVYSNNFYNKANLLTEQKIKIINSWVKDPELSERYSANLQWQGKQQMSQLLLNYEKSQNIQELNLQACKINSESLKRLKDQKYPLITKLDLSFNQISNDGIKNLRCFPNLKKLSLFRNQLKQSAVTQILDTGFFQIEELDLGLNEIGNDSGFKDFQKKLKKMKILKIASIGISQQGLKNMLVGSELHTIILCSNFKSSQEGDCILQYLKKWEIQLREIDISRNNITSEGLKQVNQFSFPYLQKLNLCENKLSNEFTCSFSGFKQLKWLNVSKNPQLTKEYVIQRKEKHQRRSLEIKFQ